MTKRRSVLAKAVRWALFLAVMLLVGKALADQFRHLHWRSLEFSPVFLLAAAAAVAAAKLIGVFITRGLLSAFGHVLPWRFMMAAFWLPQLGKYVPGKVASLASQMYMLSRRGVPASVAVNSTLIQNGLSVIAGLTIGIPLTLWGPLYHRLPLTWLWCLLAVAGGLVCLHPRILAAVSNAVLRKLHRPPLVTPGLGHYVLPVVGNFVQWACLGASLWFLVRAVEPVPLSAAPVYISVTALAQTLGFLALFAPAGLGVREGVLLLILGESLPADKAALAIVASRLLQTLADVATAGVGYLLLRQMDRERAFAAQPAPAEPMDKESPVP